MLMDTDMIYYVLEGHELQNDVQTMIQVFLANRHYTRTEEVTDAEITVKSELKQGIASAMLYRRGEKETETIPIYFLDGWIIRLEKQGDMKQAATLRRVIDSWRNHN